MSRNGSGTYSLPAGNPVVSGSTISSNWANNTLSDIATALTGSLAKDGQTVPTANIPMGGFKLTGLAAATSNGDALRFEQLPTPPTLASLGAAASGANSDITSLSGLTTPLSQAQGGTGSTAGVSSKIQSITASVAANALTISSSALALDFRSTTLGTGTATTVSGTPSNLVVPASATLGTVSAQQSRLVVLALNNAGTIELAVVNIAGGNDLTETGLISTTAISASATSASVVYSTTARTSVAYRVLGYVESTQATAGTWDTAPSTVQGQGGNALVGLPIMRSYTAQATTSGTSIDFTGIPSWAKRITLMLGVVSTSGTSDLLVQGGAGSIDTATYNDVVSGIVGTAVGSTTVTTIGFRLTPSVTAATTNSGQLVMTLIGSNRWAVTHTLTRNDGIVAIGGGDKLFSGTLDRIRLTTVNGTDTFDGGSMNILCEG
jgi:hypothetical protein